MKEMLPEHGVQTYDEIFERKILTKSDVEHFSQDDYIVAQIKQDVKGEEDERFAYAVLALLKKRYPKLERHAVLTHYKAISRFCP